MMTIRAPQAPLWFRARRYGWGWTPATWQGWAVTAVYVAVVLTWTGYLLANPDVPRRWGGSAALIAAAPVLVVSAALVVVCWIKGERPRWRWGK